MSVVRLGGGIAALLVIAACLGPSTDDCPGGVVCPPGKVCTSNGGCALGEQITACNDQIDGSQCTYTGTLGKCTNGVCIGSLCGNGLIDPGEMCDGGAGVDASETCSPDCLRIYRCGNGILDPNESCDCGDGTMPLPAGCIVQNANTPGASCRVTCELPRCGDGIADPNRFEQCDCGDGSIAPPAGCSGPNSNAPGATCRPTCVASRCGDNIVDAIAGEICDDGNNISGDGCSGDCKSSEKCGNGYLDSDAGEQCDDHNLRGQDGCSSTCAIETPVWRNLFSSYALPAARGSTAMAYDARRGRTVMFGGVGASELADTWEWDGVGWTLRVTPLAPAARDSAAMAYDAKRGRVVMFGGQNGTLLGDTWEWNGERWAEVTSATSPPPRGYPGMAYDSSRGKIVMFGGLPGSDLRTWEWDGANWTVAATIGPPATFYPAMAYDSRRGKVVMFGTYGIPNGYETQTWEWDGTRWENKMPAASPPITSGAQLVPTPLVYDASLGRVVLEFRHYDAQLTYFVGDTWAWDGTSWQNITPAAGAPDAAASSMAYDIGRDRIVSLTLNSATLEYDGTTWRSTPPFPDPLRPPAVPMAYDPLRGRVVAVDADRGSTFEWDGKAWTDVAPAMPSPRAAYAIAYAGSKHVVMVDGLDDDSSSFFYGYPLSETWAWNGTTWTELATNSPGTYGHALVYDSARDRVVVVGGLEGSYEWDGSNWTPFHVLFPDLRVPGAIYDPIRQRTVVFAGDERFVNPIDDTNQTWEWDGATAVHAMPAIQPSARDAPAMSFDPGRGRVMVFGGFVGAVNPLHDAWEWDGTVWRELSSAVQPPMGSHMVYDALAENQLLDGQWVLRWESAIPSEVCNSGFDVDGDGLVGCDDPDCWGYCTPLCTPGTSCDPAAPHCGDGTCGPIETCRMCPQDCGACVPTCGDFLCDPGETHASCAGDCP